MAAPFIYTYADVIHHCVRFVRRRGTTAQGENAAEMQSDIRACIQRAYRDLCARRSWTYLWKQGRINTSAVYDTGTVVFDLTDGDYERMLTITTGTWPTWALYGTVRIDGVNYSIEDRKSSTIITLNSQDAPTADIASTSDWEIFRTIYTLPSDFIKLAGPQGTSFGGQLVQPQDWHLMERQNYSTGNPSCYSILRDPNLIGSMALAMHPTPSSAETLDFMYLARPRALKHAGYDTNDCKGTIRTTSGSATVTGATTGFTADMVGSIIRLGEDGTTIPTAMDGHTPAVEERSIVGYTSATSLTVDAAVASTLTNMKYSISDPIDLEQVMLTAFLRHVEKELAHEFDFKTERGDAYDRYYRRAEEAYILAAEFDARSLVPRVANAGGWPVGSGYVVDLSESG